MGKGIFSKEEVNTGRQTEFDYLKGIIMIFIFQVHSFQATLSDGAPLDTIIYSVGTMTGAALFIFVMGFGAAYSGKSRPEDLAKNGVRLVIYQYLSNLLYIAVIALPYPFFVNTPSEEGTENFNFLIWVYSQFINIFFISGIIYLVLALLKALKCKVYIYPILGVIIAIIAPFVYGTPVDIPVIGYIVKLLIGKDVFVSFTPLYFLSYALIGVGLGHMYRHISDRRVFYKWTALISGVIVAVWWIINIAGCQGDLFSLADKISTEYAEPDIWRVIASLAHILLLASIIFFILNRKKTIDEPERKPGIVASQLLFYSKHISKYYVLHITIYFVALGLHGYIGFESYQCWLLMLLSMVITEIMVRSYLMFRFKLSG